MFQHVEPFAGDPILSLNEDFQKDPRPNKINLSIGICFDDAGRIPVLESVRRAEAQVVAKGGPKPYLPIEGAANFRSAASSSAWAASSARSAFIFGTTSASLRSSRALAAAWASGRSWASQADRLAACSCSS